MPGRPGPGPFPPVGRRRVGPGLYISVGIGADGPVPGPYSLPSPGAPVTGGRTPTGSGPPVPEERTFCREPRPASEEFVPEAPAVSGPDRDRLGAEGAEPVRAVREFTGRVRAAGPVPSR